MLRRRACRLAASFHWSKASCNTINPPRSMALHFGQSAKAHGVPSIRSTGSSGSHSIRSTGHDDWPPVTGPDYWARLLGQITGKAAFKAFCMTRLFCRTLPTTQQGERHFYVRWKARAQAGRTPPISSLVSRSIQEIARENVSTCWCAKSASSLSRPPLGRIWQR